MNPLAPPDFQGYFWLPGSPDSRVPGRCYTLEDGTIQLDILGILSGSVLPTDDAEIPRILGVSVNGQLVTLDNCFYKNRNFNFPGLAISKIHVNLALIGCHFDQGKEIAFDEITCYSEAIDEWLQFGPIDVSWASSPSRATISFSPPVQLEWHLPNNLLVKLNCTWTAPSQAQYREASISRKTWIGFEFQDARPLHELLEVSHRFANFVSFVVDQTLPLNAVQGYSKDLAETIGTKTRRIPIQIFYTPDNRVYPNLSHISPPFPLFAFQYVKDRFGDILSRWLENYEKFASSFNLYFATRTGRDLYLDNRFLMLVQALESLHRHSSTASTFSSPQYATLCETLRGVIPEVFKDWLEARLKYGNEPSLRQRLKYLVQGFESIFEKKRKLKDLISQVVDTRNYLTHYDQSLQSKAAREDQLYKLCIALEILFQVHMAIKCGFSSEEVIDLFNRSHIFSRKAEQI